MARQFYNLGILEAPHKPGVETILRGDSAVHPMVSRRDIIVQTLSRVLALIPDPEDTLN